MSLLNLIGGSRRQAAPARPTTTTGKADTVSIHAQISNPSRQASIDSLAPASHSKQRPSRAQTDLTPHVEPRDISSRSTTSPDKKPSTGWLSGSTRILPSSSLRSSPSASQTSLVEPHDDEIYQHSSPRTSSQSKSRSGSRKSVLHRKASSSLEQEWMEVGNYSSDEDDFVKARREGSLPTEIDKGKNRGYGNRE